MNAGDILWIEPGTVVFVDAKPKQELDLDGLYETATGEFRLQIGQCDSSRRAPASPAMECATGSATSLQVPIMNSNPVASRIAAAVVVGIWILFAHVISNIFRYGRAW